MSDRWYEGDPGDETDVAADDLSDIFMDEETYKIASQAEKYRREYEPPKQKGDS